MAKASTLYARVKVWTDRMRKGNALIILVSLRTVTTEVAASRNPVHPSLLYQSRWTRPTNPRQHSGRAVQNRQPLLFLLLHFIDRPRPNAHLRHLHKPLLVHTTICQNQDFVRAHKIEIPAHDRGRCAGTPTALPLPATHSPGGRRTRPRRWSSTVRVQGGRAAIGRSRYGRTSRFSLTLACAAAA